MTALEPQQPAVRVHDDAPAPPPPAARRTRGKTARGRLAQLDEAVLLYDRERLHSAPPAACVVDLGFSQAWTTLELADRLDEAWLTRNILGVDIDADRVAWAARDARPGVTFRHGGFVLPLAPGEEVCLIRALNVLRGYPAADCAAARDTLVRQLTPDGVLIEGSNGKHDGVLVTTWWSPQGGRAIATHTLFATDFRGGFHPRMFLPRLAPDQRIGRAPAPPFAALLARWTACWERAEPSPDPRVRFAASAALLQAEAPGVDLRGADRGLLRLQHA